jgi:hypothetical protein
MPKTAIIGSGIAGLAVAYGLKKLGKDVVIFDKNLNIKGATWQQHGWFHTGYLYLGQKDIEIYRNFVENYLKMKCLSLDFNISHGSNSWLSNENIDYHFYAKPWYVSLFSNWDLKLKRLILRSVGENPSGMGIYLKYKRKKFKKSKIFNSAFLIKSPDRVLRTDRVVSDIRKFLQESGVDFVEKEITKSQLNFEQKKINDEIYENIFFCCGYGINDFFPETVGKVYSLLGVHKGNIKDSSFVLIHPDSVKTINCIRHKNIENEAISIIGDGVNFNKVPNEENISEFKDKIKKTLGVEVQRIILGEKAEILDNDTRDYRHKIIEKVSGNYIVTPGKFSNFPSIVFEITNNFERITKENKTTWHPAHKDGKNEFI